MAAQGSAFDKVALFNQTTLWNILNGRDNLSTQELITAINGLTKEQRLDCRTFLEGDVETLAGLPEGQGILAMANVKTLLENLPINYNYLMHLYFYIL